MTPHQPNPPEDKPSVLQRLMDYMLKNPFIALWNVALIVGGTIALFYFAQIGYLPDLDPKSATSMLISIAMLGCVMVGFLTVIFIIPASMIRGEVWKTHHQFTAASAVSPPQPASEILLQQRRPQFGRMVVLYGIFGYSFYGFLASFIPVDASGQDFSMRLRWACIGIGPLCILLLLLNYRWMLRRAASSGQNVEDFLGHGYKTQNLMLLLTWLMVTPGTAMMIFLSLGKSRADNTADILMTALFWLLYLIVNAVLAVHHFKPPVSRLIYPVAGLVLFVVYLFIPSNPVNISRGVFIQYALGAMSNTKFIVKRAACDAVNLLADHACEPVGDGTSGCITPKRMASRVGSEFLLVLSTSSKENGKNEVKVPLQKTDVLTWGTTASSQNQKKSCAAKS